MATKVLEIEVSFKLLQLFFNYFYTIHNVLNAFIAAPQGGFIVPHVWEIVYRKNDLYNDFLKFAENRDKEFKLEPKYFNFSCTGN